MLPLCFAVTVQVVRVQGRHSLRHAHYAPCQADRVNTALGSTRRATARLHYAVHQHQAIQQVNNRHESLLKQPTHPLLPTLVAGRWSLDMAVRRGCCRQQWMSSVATALVAVAAGWPRVGAAPSVVDIAERSFGLGGQVGAAPHT
jgi:hypothetical protein